VSLASNTRQTCVQVRAAGLLAQLQVQRGACDGASSRPCPRWLNRSASFSSQVRAAELLAQLQVQRGAYDRAAGVHEALALRRSGPGAGEEAALQRRVDSLHDAVLQVRSWRTSSIDDVRSLAMRQTGEAPCCVQ